ncbi:hypothetical protein E4U41_007552 [Claviceps citrina]|nr:hypothetical protein E4U41_007552 [Claviceps citrina]
MASPYDLVTELPDGQLVCREHRLVHCYRCCVDFSFMLEDEDSNEDEDSDDDPAELPDFHRHNSIRRGTGRIFPTVFLPPSSDITPDVLFPARPRVVTRFFHRDDSRKMLIYTDGACLNNGQAEPRAGWAFVFKPASNPTDESGSVSLRLENKGPFGDLGQQTSNRAELRAVIAALRFRAWNREGFETVVIATDSEYVAKGATSWACQWVRNGWNTSKGPVKNRDLWKALLGEVEKWDSRGVQIQFWRIPRELNVVADRAAKRAAQDVERVDEFTDILGVLTVG